MIALLRFFSLRHARRHPLRLLLGAASIALGVALYVSVDAANTTMIRSFEASASDLAGKAELQVTTAGGMGVEAEALDRLAGVPGVLAAPVIQRSVTFRGLKDGQILVLGIDFARDAAVRGYTPTGRGDPRELVAAAILPNAIILTRRFADRNGLKTGARLQADTSRGLQTLVIAALLEDEGPARALDGNVGVMNVTAAQTLFGLKGRFDRIELAAEGIASTELRSRAHAALGPAFDLRPLPKRSTAVEVAIARLESMVIISAIALVVGLFIIYNSVSISVVERVREIGILRSIGATRRQILAAILLEWAVVGAAGSGAGAAAGFGLARAFVAMSAAGANMLTFAIKVQAVEFSWSGAGIALAAGTLTTLGAALFPALAAMGISPIGLIRQSTYRFRHAPRHGRALAAGVVLLAGCAAVLTFAGRRVPPGALLGVTTVAFFAIALTGPQLTFWAARAARPVLRRLFRIEGYLAADSLSRTPQRTALTVSAFGGAVSLMVATSSIVGALQLSTERWMQDAFPFDLSVNATDLQSALYSSAAYGPDVLDSVREVPGVASAYGVRATFVPRAGVDVMLMSVDVAEFFAMHRLRGRSGGPLQFDTPGTLAALRSGEGVIISDNFAELNRLEPGGTVTLPSPSGPRVLRILGRVEDYSWPAGTVLMDRAAYARLWGDDSLTYTDVLLSPGADERDVRRRISEALKDRTTVFVYSVPQLQEIARSTLDQALRLSYVQVLIALVIGFLGIVNTLLISVLLRTREIGLLRAVGTTRSQIRRGVMIESVFIALMGSALGVFAGLSGSGWPIRLYILAKTGFWMPFVIPWTTLAIAAGAGAVLGILASLAPARRAAGMNVLEAIAWE